MTEVDLFGTLMKILVVFALLGVTLVVLRKTMGPDRVRRRSRARRKADEPVVEVLETRQIGRGSLVVARYRGAELLLGVAEGGVTRLAGDEESFRPAHPAPVDDADVIDLRETSVGLDDLGRDGIDDGRVLERLRELTVRR